MIYESKYWKNDLLKHAKSLRQRLTQQRWPEQSFARVEQTIMIGFYSIRKLAESQKLSESVKNQTVGLTTHKWLGKPVTKMNRHDYWEFYDMESSQTIERDLLFICHQIVHSFVFVISFDESLNFEGILVASDRERNKVLYMIRIQQIIDLFEQIGSNYPDGGKITFNEKTQDYEYKFE